MADTRGIRAGRAYVELGVSDRLSRGLRRAQRRLRAFGAGVRSIGTQLAGVGVAAALPFAASVKTFTSLGDTVEKMARRTGISVEALSELGFAAEQSGADIETLEKGVRTMQRSINDAERGLTTATDAMDDLGLSVDDLRGLKPEDQFKLIADRISGITDPSKRAALAMQLLGRAGTRLLPLMEDGAAGIERLQQEARDLGLTISTQTARDAANLADTFNILWRVVKQGAFVVGGALAPSLTAIAKSLTNAIVKASDWVQQNRTLVVTAAKVIAAVVGIGGSLIALGLAITIISIAIGGLATALGVAQAAFAIGAAAIGALLSPIGLAVAAIVGLGATVLIASGVAGEALDWLKQQFGALRDFVGNVVGGITDALAAGDVALAARILWAGVKVAWQQGTDALERIWIKFSSGFQKLGINAFAGLQKAWINVRGFFRKSFPELTRGLSKAWASSIGFIRQLWVTAQGEVEKGFTAILSAAAGVDADIIAQSLDDIDAETARRVGKISDDTTAAKAEADRVANLTPEQLDREKAADLAAVEKAQQEALAALDERTGERVAAAQKELDDARAELDALRAKAKQQRNELGDGPGPRQTIDEFADQLAGVGETIARGAEVRGTFNAAAVQGLLGGDAQERTAKATEQTAKNTKRIVDATRNGGLAFA